MTITIMLAASKWFFHSLVLDKVAAIVRFHTRAKKRKEKRLYTVCLLSRTASVQLELHYDDSPLSVLTAISVCRYSISTSSRHFWPLTALNGTSSITFTYAMWPCLWLANVAGRRSNDRGKVFANKLQNNNNKMFVDFGFAGWISEVNWKRWEYVSPAKDQYVAKLNELSEYGGCVSSSIRMFELTCKLAYLELDFEIVCVKTQGIFGSGARWWSTEGEQNGIACRCRRNCLPNHRSSIVYSIFVCQFDAKDELVSVQNRNDIDKKCGRVLLLWSTIVLYSSIPPLATFIHLSGRNHT